MRDRARTLVGQSVAETHTVDCTEGEGTVNQYVRPRTYAGKHRAERSKKRVGIVMCGNKKCLFVCVPSVDTSTPSFLSSSFCFMMDAHKVKCANGVH